MVIQKALCRQKCNQPLGCGHLCKRLCHGFGTDLHSQPCLERVDDECDAPHKHPVLRACFQGVGDVACGKCEVLEKERVKKEARDREECERKAQARGPRLSTYTTVD